LDAAHSGSKRCGIGDVGRGVAGVIDLKLIFDRGVERSRANRAKGVHHAGKGIHGHDQDRIRRISRRLKRIHVVDVTTTLTCGSQRRGIEMIGS
jgi:hypothetical protein